MIQQNFERQTKLPLVVVIGISILCVLPFILNLLGADFSSVSKPLPTGDAKNILIDDLFYRLSGAFTHTILEWSAFCIALFTFLLAIVHYRISKDITIPVIGVALFCAGCMDAFHTLAADRLIEAAADNRNLIPFTWAISRVFNALIMIIGVGVFLFRSELNKKMGVPFVIYISIAFGITAYAIIHYCAVSTQLPQTMYPDAFITRPWDVGPLVMFIFAGLYVFPKFYKKHPSIFAHSLVICVIPEIAVEMHMAFGSTALFDNHFNVAHFLKIFAYAVPLFGLFFDYIFTYKEKEIIQNKLTEKTKESEKTNAFLEGILENAVDAIVSIDIKGNILSANSATVKLFGYSTEEMLGQNVKMLMPAPYKDAHDSYLSKYAETGKREIIGVGREVTGQRKDGSTFPMVLSVSENKIGESHSFTGLIRDITEQKNIIEQLQERQDELSRSNEELERFAYVASHDLQEPLRMVSSYTNLLAMRYKDKIDDDANDFINYATDGAKRMQVLINDLLVFSRLNSKNNEFSTINTDELCEEVLDILDVTIDEANALITKDVLPTIKGDEVQIKQLIQNLISNAIKYGSTDHRNDIHISAIKKEDCWEFSISDKGIGIDEQYFEKIFIIFKRLHGNTAYSGTGIGLAICKKIVERHHGKIWLESSLGQGATFYFTLPAD